MAPKKKSAEHATYNSIEQLASGIRGKFGDGALIQSESDTNVKFIPTGMLSLDLALGGGVPMGRVIECFGPESSGKTSLCLHIIGVFQRLNMNCMFIDAEYAYDKSYASHFRVDTDKLLLTQPDNGEQALEIALEGASSGQVNLIVIDSVAALTPKAEIDGEMGDSHMGLQARMMGQGLRKLTNILGKKECSVIFINQLRQKIGIMFGNPETTTGGNALKFYASQRIDVRKIGRIPADKDVPPKGMQQRVKVVKNKVAPPFRETELDMYFNTGYDILDDILEVGMNFNVITQSGPMYKYGELVLGRGREESKQGIKGMDKSVRKEMRAAIKAAYIGA